MGWFDDFLDLAKTAGAAYYAIATKPEVRKKIAGKALDSFNAPGTIGEKLVSGIDAITFRAGYNPNEIPQVGKDVIRTAGDVIGFAESQLPGVGAIHSGLATATELAAGRDPAHLGEFAAETAVAFAPPGVAEAYEAYKALSGLPVADAAIKREIIAPPKPSSIPTQTPVPTIPEMPKFNPKPVPAEVPELKRETKAEIFAKPEPQQYSRIQRLDNLARSQQQDIQPFLPRPIQMSRNAFIREHQHLVKVLEKGKPAELKKEAKSQLAELKKVKRRVKKTK
jgi:hypothetical protein